MSAISEDRQDRDDRDVVVTGIGLVSCVGEGVEAHLAALAGISEPGPWETERFAPYPVRPAPALDLSTQIPKKSDQRQMEPWQRLGVYAAGAALESAGMKDDAQLKARTHVIVAAGGGERDYDVDGQVLTAMRTHPAPEVLLNERLMSDVRPTLFLAQLSNLLAGNIAIVHGVTGASRTFMGEEQAGVDAIRIAHARIASGQNDVFLVGGSFNAERADSILAYAMGRLAYRGAPAMVAQRETAGFVLGSGGAFLVLEARAHARARGARVLAEIAAVGSARTGRGAGALAETLGRLFDETGTGTDARIVSGALGLPAHDAQERSVLAARAPGAAPIVTQDLVGHLMEAHAPAGVALAAGLIAAGEAREAAVTSIGHQRGAGLVRLVAGRA
ncbi:beta-ketoacyl-ACP synthase [Salinarimonas sp. NSM]|uniref:beta-ketoacyl-ACP synthase n=1 Tax=Salinarimonas sp. NSM TaxID=3458003 RepID=UPI0040351B5E